MKQYFKWLKNLSLPKKAVLGTATLLVLAAAVGGNQQTTNSNATAANKTNTTKTQSSDTKKIAHAPAITTKTVTETQSIAYTSTTTQDGSLAKGSTKLTTPGVNGTQTLTYEVTSTGGQQTAKKLVKTEVTTAPVMQVTAIGTYVAPAPTPPPALSCPNGTYVNSVGNTVCSPYSSPSAPAGATARCGDGTYSFSQSRSGTCSHHGGVATWL